METDEWGYPVDDQSSGGSGSTTTKPATTTGSTGSSLNDYIKTGGTLVNLGLDSYGKFTGSPAGGRTPPPSTPTPAKSTSGSLTQYLPWILGGGALLLLLGIVLPSLRGK